MTRNTPQALLNLLDDPEVKPFYAVEMDFDTAPVRFWTGYGDRTIAGETYLGSGNLLSISGLDEVNDLSAKSITLTERDTRFARPSAVMMWAGLVSP